MCLLDGSVGGNLWASHEFSIVWTYLEDGTMTKEYIPIYDIIKETGIKKGSMHCFSGSTMMAKEFIKLGFKIGVDGPITYENNKKGIELVKEIDLKDLLLETDSPYLSPVPNRGKQNSPLNLEFIASKIADIKGIDIKEVEEVTTKTAKELYRL